MMKLKITLQKDKVLSKTQLTFNKLTKRIDTLTHKIVIEEKKLDVISQEYVKKILPLEEESARCHMDMALLLHKATLTHKYGKKHKKTIGAVILFLCDRSFAAITPNKEEEEMYDHWSESTYKEELEEEMSDLKAFLSNQLKYHDLDIDLSDIDETPEGFAKFQQRMQEELARKAEEESSQFSHRKKTKKQLEKELRLKDEEGKQLKSIRSIYISLAKVLHPDANTEDLEKIQKEELMKKVTKAYQEKDLATLLKLEMEWLGTESDNLDKLSDEKLKLYIASLRERVTELEQEIWFLHQRSKYEAIRVLGGATEKAAFKEINRKAEMMQNILFLMKVDYAALYANQSKNNVLNFATELHQGLDFDDFDDDRDFDLVFTDEMLAELDGLFDKKK